MTDTTMNTGAASLSDEQILEHFDMPGLNLEATLDAHDIGLLLTGIRTLLATPTPQADADFKNFHRLLCERFGYVHDEKDWKRDQLSLIEHIASRAAIAAGGAQEAIYQVMVGEKWVDSTAAEYAAVSNEKRIVYAAPLPRVAATMPATAARYIVIGYGETDHPQAAFINEREQLLDAVLCMMYTHASDADPEIREAYAKDLTDDDEWSEGIWSTEFEIGGITIYDLGYGSAASNGEQA